ncbi:MAG: twin arginine-targeting protein translocase TatC [Chloroflexi bacterium GWB2_49_20]|nr:MAG: twin arginine-targeting protein translocase TatC [Chloroflexi bacterium GWB2_49_20]OGN78600.1 MAG: twin arginine-targeting protein translocase TatC [Chloroflexi bacterium GWC2_49_37]OGN85702.1 MAG: twin arginine-targeting protein translocase TatC [Chloroflexi bacterium GWD2_49_16]HBG75075.1 twin-arginine translocase subunit TatC [Anaerolineae bacterium]HCC78100.1 twin-arginine translocase subunit TatC [Anaerolineae bacterium]
MRKTLNRLWRIITFPFRGLFWLLGLPFRFLKQANTFLNADLDDRPLADAFAASLQIPSALLEHVEALRKHLLRMLLGLVVGVAVSFFLSAQLVDFLSQPVGGITALKAIDVTESVGVFMRIALFAGIALASPYLAFELWLFAAPGLKPGARKLGLIGIPLTTLLLVAGMLFAYYFMLPSAMPFLLNFMGIQTIPRPSSYINFVSGLMLWIGVAFEFPLVIFVLSLMGIAKPKFMAQQWRIAVIVIAVISAVITPTVDPVNMALVMGPMIVLYFLSIGLSYMASFSRKKSLADKI